MGGHSKSPVKPGKMKKAIKSPILHAFHYKRNQKNLTFQMPAPVSATSTCEGELQEEFTKTMTEKFQIS